MYIFVCKFKYTCLVFLLMQQEQFPIPFSSLLPDMGVRVAYPTEMCQTKLRGPSLGVSTLASRVSSTTHQVLDLFDFNGINNNINWHFLSTCYVPGTLLSSLLILYIKSSQQPSEKGVGVSHFADKETEAQKISELPKIA